MRRQAAVFVTVPADELVGAFRLRHQPRAVARLLPPHITVLPPFSRDVEDDDLLVAALAEHFGASRVVRGRARAASGTFPRHVWLAPEPHEDFVALIARTRDRFPELVRDGDRRAGAASDDRGDREGRSSAAVVAARGGGDRAAPAVLIHRAGRRAVRGPARRAGTRSTGSSSDDGPSRPRLRVGAARRGRRSCAPSRSSWRPAASRRRRRPTR